MKYLNEFGTSHRTIQSSYIEEYTTNTECPVFVYPEDTANNDTTEAYPQNTHIMIPYTQYYPTYVIWTQNVSKILSSFDSTVSKCKQYTHPGIYHASSKFLFILDNIKISRILLANFPLKTHPRTAIARRVPTTSIDKTVYKIFGFDFFNPDEDIILNFIWSNGHQLTSLDQAFTSINDFNQFELKVCGIPNSEGLFAEKILTNDSEIYGNFWGREVLMLEDAARIFNFRFKIDYFPDEILGNVNVSTGQWNGLIRQIADGKYDFGISDVFLYFLREQVIDGSVWFDSDFLTLASPAPSLFPKYLAFLSPFTVVVWICIFVALILASITFFVIAVIEGGLIDYKLREWSTLPLATWFAYGSILVQQLFFKTTADRGRALRVAISGWLLACLVISLSYSSSLRSFLITPIYQNSINSFQEVTFCSQKVKKMFFCWQAMIN